MSAEPKAWQIAASREIDQAVCDGYGDWGTIAAIIARHSDETVEKLAEALRWYEERVSNFARKDRTDTYLGAVATELSLDNGARARESLAMVKPAKEDRS